MFERLLIANRGEIACRIARTARRMGVRTVAVHSDADADAPHVRLADEACAIGPAPPGESYLRGDVILETARHVGAGAIHPGYGFLSENADFAQACADAGVVFVGPPPEAIRAMGEKDSARRAMEDAGAPVIPGHRDESRDLRTLATRARMLGFPVMIKAVAGGGGRGIRRVDRELDLAAAVAAARREARAAFGDDRLLLEKYIAGARHVEAQVFADTHGNVVHLFERECSIQRRYQKIIEEAPSPAVTPELRAAIGAAAVRAARAIGYVGAGAVEFLLDRSGAFYFMEMNTRLQVEHTVTEAIAGVDLVEWQLRVANGEPLPLGQDDIAFSGHAVEARLCAEDPARGFLPAVGRIVHLRLPPESEFLRIDSGAVEGGAVTPHYDSLLAKVIVHGRDRDSAVRRLSHALANVELVGPPTNLAWLRAVARHPAFLSGEFDTGFAERHAAELTPAAAPAPTVVLAAAALFALLDRKRRAAPAGSPWDLADGWRLNAEARDVIRFIDGGAPVTVDARADGDGFVMTLPDGALPVSGAFDGDGRLRARVGGIAVPVTVARREDARGRMTLAVMTQDLAHELVLDDPLAAADAEEDDPGRLTAPMPGRVVRVSCEEGARVERGAALLTIEAMKMEHTIVAPSDGRVARVLFAVGDRVDEGERLLDFTAEDAA